MKKTIIALIALFVSATAFSQQAHYQGKIFIGGKPATGKHSIQFSIGAPLNWASPTQLVDITNGLFSTVINFPANLFDENNSVRQMVVVLDTNIIVDTVSLFAPLERDPTVRNYIKDSITWNDIKNKPVSNGRLKDSTGFITPVGGVIAYAGHTVPDGWLLCDGRLLNRANYPDLFDAIGTAWGSSSSSDFRLPDMRGMFLRGVDNSPTEGTSNTDPNSSTRTTTNSGGNTGNNVGTKQDEELKSHAHSTNIQYSGNLTGGSSGGGHNVYERVGVAGSDNKPSTFTGGLETRPKNVYVYYIIKY
jgi:microcystin-dependent protein